jgi:DNA polymerase-3 subunit delta
VLITGSDPALRSRSYTDVVDSMVGDTAQSLVVTQLSGSVTAKELHEALTQESFFGPAIVVIKDGALLAKPTLEVLVEWLADRGRGGRCVVLFAAGVPSAVKKAAQTGGAVIIDSDPGRNSGAKLANAKQLVARGGLTLTPGALAGLAEAVGEEQGRIPAIVDLLVATYGQNGILDEGDLAGMMGAPGGVPPWELTDAIDAGLGGEALTVLARMIESGRVPLAVLATLSAHYERMFRLAGMGIGDVGGAAAFLGLKGSTYPASKALGGIRLYGEDGLGAMVLAIANAGVDLKGGSGWPGQLVMEVLVARLAAGAKRARRVMSTTPRTASSRTASSRTASSRTASSRTATTNH